ncbi:hypothetical protein BCR36DRAFT_132892 [Piromyces finnis]|uniref:Uncharacterized protein n=1 Tax=Piromyces finnis TaxID=1754191 RepID=A0A1Y1V0J2_9FUNG|nr:hypothetical protein BCR36DRAFT_132892 [Piromyces finnis]|eukprot:ORX43977.1 hypothetical protein BCR36DRAFT_132892 [Piromyces finnis]
MIIIVAYDEFEAYGSSRRENFIPHYKSFKDSTRFHIPLSELSAIPSSSNFYQSQGLRDSHQVKLNFAYGDILGNTYVKSLERFTENMSDSIKDFVFEYIDAITEGGHSLAKATEYLMDKNSSVIENFIPPSKKIKLNPYFSENSISKKQISEKENKEILNQNNSNIINNNIPLQLTPYEIKQIENIINNIIVKKNYEYEQREIGMIESIIRDNHIDYLSVIKKEEISTIIKDIISKHSRMNIDINNKLVSDKLIKDYIESNIIELKLYQEMKFNGSNHDLKKEAQLEYNIQKRFLEILNISSNNGIDKISRNNELQIKKLEQDILLKKKLEQENIRKQQELQKQILEQNKTKQKEKQLEQQLLLRKCLEQQQKINANQLTQFNLKEERNPNLKDQQEKLMMLNHQQFLKSFQVNDSKLSETKMKNNPLFDQLKSKQQQQQQSSSQIKPISQISTSQDKKPNSNFSNFSYGNLLNNGKGVNNITSNVSTSNISLNNLNFMSQQQQLLLQQRLKNYLQNQQGRKLTSSHSLLPNSKLGVNTSSATIVPSTNSIDINSNNSNINSLVTNQRISPVSSTNIASILAASSQKLNNSNILSSQNISSIISNNKNILSDKAKANLLSTKNKNDFSSPYGSVSQSLPSSQAFSNYSSLIASNQKLSNTSLLANDLKLKTKTNPATSLANNLKLSITQSVPDYSSLLTSKPTIVSTSNISSLLSSSNTNDINKLPSTSSSLTIGDKKQSQKQGSIPTSIPTTQTLLNSKSKKLPIDIDLSHILNTTSFPTTTTTTTKSTSIMKDTKIPTTQSLESNLSALLSNTNNANSSKIQSSSNLSNLNPKSKLNNNIPTAQLGPDFSSLLISKTKPQSTSSFPTTQSGPDFSSLFDATIVPSTQSLNDIMNSKKVVATTNPPSLPTVDLSSIDNNQKLMNDSSVTSKFSSLLSTKLTKTQPDSSFNNLLSKSKLTNDYSSLLGINTSISPTTTTTTPDISMLLPNSGIGSSSIVSSSLSQYLLSACNTSLPPSTSLPQQLSLLNNSNIVGSLQTPSSQQNLTNTFLANNSISSTSKTTKEKSNSKNPQLPTSSISSFF